MAPTGQRKVYWQNLREEPLVFINGQPFVVREADQPFSNLEYTGERACDLSTPMHGILHGQTMQCCDGGVQLANMPLLHLLSCAPAADL